MNNGQHSLCACITGTKIVPMMVLLVTEEVERTMLRERRLKWLAVCCKGSCMSVCPSSKARRYESGSLKIAWSYDLNKVEHKIIVLENLTNNKLDSICTNLMEWIPSLLQQQRLKLKLGMINQKIIFCLHCQRSTMTLLTTSNLAFESKVCEDEDL